MPNTIEPAPRPKPDLSRWDRPLEELTADIAARRLAEGAAAELRHRDDPLDKAFAQLAVEHSARFGTANRPSLTPGRAA